MRRPPARPGGDGGATTARHRAARAWRRGQHGWPVAYPVAQFPNAPLLLAITATVVERLAAGEVADVAAAVATVGLVAWAWLELAAGVNLLRRVLGLVVLGFQVAGLS